MTAGNWIAVAAVMVSVAALALSLFRNGKADASHLTTLTAKMESIQVSLAEIKAEMRRYEGENREIRDRLILVESSAKQAHRRIDEIPGVTNRSRG